jgi:hypothetical protein
MKCEICEGHMKFSAVKSGWKVCHRCYRHMSNRAKDFVRNRGGKNVDAECEVIAMALDREAVA